MSLVRKFAVVVLTVLLVATLVTGNVLAAAHLTVLDPGFVQNSIEEEGGYQVVENATVEAAASQVPPSIADTVDTEALLRDAVNQSYLEAQTERNVDALYEYLHGGTDTLNLSVDTEPLKQDVVEAVEDQVRNATVPELLERADTELPGPVNQSTVERMTANESGYESVKQDFRDRVRERILDEAVERAWQGTSNDEKLALIIEDYNPDDYTEAEKEQLVADNETEIRTALRERIETERGDEIDQRVDSTLASINESTAPAGENATGLEAAATDMQATFVEGLTTDMPYSEFRSDLDAAKADAAAAVGNRTEATLDDQLADRIDLTAELDPGARDSLEQAQQAVTWLDRLAIVLPILALVLVGLVYFVTRSVQTVAASLGVSLLSAGLPIYLSLGYLQSTIEQTVEEQMLAGDPEPFIRSVVDLLLGIVAQLFGRVGAVSLAFVVAGLLALVGWLVLRYEVLGDDERTAAEAAAAADAAAMDEESETEPASPDARGETETAVAGDESDGDDPLADRGDGEN